MVRERDRATIENKLKPLRAALVAAGREGGVEAVSRRRRPARLTAGCAAATIYANTFKHEIDGVAMVPATFPANISRASATGPSAPAEGVGARRPRRSRSSRELDDARQ